MSDIEKKIDEILAKGVSEFIDPDESFRKKLKDKAEGRYQKDIIIKFGIDPTRPDIHLGHAVCFRKLRQLQDLGCKAVFLVGDYTAQIGDPTGKSKVRPEIEQKQVEENVKTYINQIEKIIDVEKDKDGNIKVDSKRFSWIRNSDWFTGVTDLVLPDDMEILYKNKEKVLPNSFVGKAIVFENTRMQKLINKSINVITMNSLLWTLKHITLHQLEQRDMFKERKNANEDLYMHEMLYPVFQGIDSYVINKLYGSCDIEVGGTDQTFHMHLGRDIQKINASDLKSFDCSTDLQSILSVRLLEGTDGKEKMSKSLDNYIGITEEPNSMFGKVMSIPDTSIANYFELCTDEPMDKIKQMSIDMKTGKENPRDLKLKLAEEIVRIYHDKKEAQKAKDYFVDTFSKKETPENIPEVEVSKDKIKLTEFLVFSVNADSLSDARRKIEQGGVEIDNKKETDWQRVLNKKDNGSTLKIGKHSFVKIKF